ncbi:hypothetical protein JKP88DRAFT_236844 [Tribonema minus]|uniref:Secreted protein n=1 Tax=Tribonema minus TaxID=303371 RepID=A0A836CH88_9STRA|nr:hypothetical protein JKP88DRAFT_236844 [Tribonema minus]
MRSRVYSETMLPLLLLCAPSLLTEATTLALSMPRSATVAVFTPSVQRAHTSRLAAALRWRHSPSPQLRAWPPLRRRRPRRQRQARQCQQRHRCRQRRRP